MEVQKKSGWSNPGLRGALVEVLHEGTQKPSKIPHPSAGVEVLELTLHDDIYLVMGVRDSKGEAGEP
jgi:hypothetical protein